ncbi:MAG TPA: NtaA/DmoA family FMN-dependent monooxygenase, partial [Acetobacteraceae bacterium]|nr:NtaA/DmoA family FMN-dependent monooxygenase [Acetobacteraceae bacterium]
VTVPKADPMPLVPLLGQATKGLGIIATMTTAFYPPYLGARLAATLDHITRGRAGINLVTAHNDRAAQNFGLERHHEHDKRYEMAAEWIDVVDKLWSSWAPGAVVADQDAGIYANVAKVRPIEHEGTYYRCRGPLNLPAGPQGRPVICQAGGSPAGRRFAARYADTIIALVRDVAEAKAYRADIAAKAAEAGRPADSCKVLFCVSVTMGESADEAQERKRRRRAAQAANLEPRLAALSFFGARDLSKLPLDEPVEREVTNASRTMVEAYTKRGRTLREIAADDEVNGIPFVGTPDKIASEMADAMAEIGGDGFLFTEPLSRRNITEVTDGLVPELQRRGQTRRAYAHSRLRDNLLEF